MLKPPRIVCNKPLPKERAIRFTAKHYQSLEPITLEFSDSEVKHVYDSDDAETSLICAPVFIDLQINGYGGVNFSDSSSLSKEGIAKVVNTLYSHGVAYFLPTVTTSSSENLKHCFEILASSCEDSELARSMPGFHLEGPYISSIDGPRGAHPTEHAKPPSWEAFLKLQDAAQDRIKLVTLAPELPGALNFIEKLREQNIVPAIGHSNAETKDIEDAALAGAVLSTHLGNGAHASIRRHPNYIWDQLANDNLWASLIVDGFHLPPNVVKVMTRAKGAEKMILVTDAVTVSGLKPGHYHFMGKDIELKPEGVVRLSGTDYLAGAALKMPDAIFNAARFTGLSQETVIAMASLHPYDLLSTYADLSFDIFSGQTFSLLKWEGNNLEVVATVIEGRTYFSRFGTYLKGAGGSDN